MSDLPWKCAGCGAIAEDKKKPCDCITNCCFRTTSAGYLESCTWDLEPEEPREGSAWLIHYEDVDVPDELFVGHRAEECAHRRYEQISISYNAHLFIKIRGADWDTEEHHARASK